MTEEKHIADEQLLRLLREPTTISAKSEEHLLSCSECRERSELFILIDTELNFLELPQPGSSYQELVMQQIRKKHTNKATPSIPIWIISLVGIFMLATPVYFFKTSMHVLLAAFHPYAIGLIGIVLIIVIVGMLFEHCRDYKMKLKIIQKAADLQQF